MNKDLSLQRSQLALQSAIKSDGLMDINQFARAKNFKLDLTSKFKRNLKPGDAQYMLPETELQVLQTERASAMAPTAAFSLAEFDR